MQPNTGRCVFFEVGQEFVKAAATVTVEQTICTD